MHRHKFDCHSSCRHRYTVDFFLVSESIILRENIKDLIYVVLAKNHAVRQGLLQTLHIIVRCIGFSENEIFQTLETAQR